MRWNGIAHEGFQHLLDVCVSVLILLQPLNRQKMSMWVFFPVYHNLGCREGEKGSSSWTTVNLQLTKTLHLKQQEYHQYGHSLGPLSYSATLPAQRSPCSSAGWTSRSVKKEGTLWTNWPHSSEASRARYFSCAIRTCGSMRCRQKNSCGRERVTKQT